MASISRFFKVVVFGGILVICTSLAYANDINTIRVLKISAQDQRAIIKTTAGKMRVIKVGDPIDKDGKVIEITTNRIVIEEKKGNDIERILIRLIDGKQKIERIKKIADKQPLLLAPAEKDKTSRKNKKESRED